ncbi:hypothetical protein DFH27DRAFT_587337 [Peziza echinospora]|nr:hypothetical protein DFH27DRAFT_587337 [Peziza echinospora]
MLNRWQQGKHHTLYITNSIMSTTPYKSFLGSKLFEIVLADPGNDEGSNSDFESAPVKKTEQLNGEVDNGTSLYIHKKLFASLSPELSKHAYNEMKEGTTDMMVLKEVDKASMVRLIEWAYTGLYEGSVESSEALITHLKLYAIADRFNITTLRELSFSRCSELIVKLGNVQSPKDLEAILGGMRYAFENLPSRNLFDMPKAASDSAEPENTENNILLYLGQYAAYILVALRGQEGFGRLIEDNAEFAKAVVSQTSAANFAPWALRAANPTQTRKSIVTTCRNCGVHLEETRGFYCEYCGEY